jgi:hypothetical protein
MLAGREEMLEIRTEMVFGKVVIIDCLQFVFGSIEIEIHKIR